MATETRAQMLARFPDNNLGAIDADDSRALVDNVYDLIESKGVANGIPSLDATGKVPAGQLPAPPSGITWEGAYSAATPYQAGDVVSYGGRYYLALQNSTGSTPA
jgi:hypothetical protein